MKRLSGVRNFLFLMGIAFTSLYFLSLFIYFYQSQRGSPLTNLLYVLSPWLGGVAVTVAWVLAALVFCWLLRLLIHVKPIPLPDKGIALILLLVSFAVHVLMLINVKITQSSDYSMYYDLSLAYARDGIINSTKYIMVVAPNALIFLATMGEFIRFLGQSTLSGEWMNLLFMVGSTVALYVLARRVLNKNAAFIVALLFTLSPNNLLFSLCLATEPMALFTQLLAMIFALRALDQNRVTLALGFALLSGVLFSLSNTVRAVAIAFFIALLLYILFWRLIREGRFSWTGVYVLIGLGAGYAAFSYLFSAIQWEVYKTALGIGYGWSLFEGLDPVSNGGWRAENAAALMQAIETYPVSQVQSHLLELVKQRVASFDAMTWLRLFGGKGINIWLYNDYAYSTVIVNNSAIGESAWDLSKMLAPIADTINYLHRLTLMTFAVCLGHFALFKRGKQLGEMILFTAPVLFLILFHSFATSIPRYHFPVMPVMLIAICYALQSTPPSRKRGEMRL